MEDSGQAPRKRLAISSSSPNEDYIPTPKVIRHVLVATFFQSASVYLILESVFMSLSKNFKTYYRLSNVLYFSSPVFGAYLADNVFGVYFSVNCLQSISILLNASLLACHIFGEDDIASIIILISMFVLGALGNLFLALGCDQFVLPMQKHQFTNYIIHYFTCTELGKIVGRYTFIIFSKLRICVGIQACYPIQAIALASSFCAFIAILVVTKHFMKKLPSVDVKKSPGRVICCFFYAVYTYIVRKKPKPRHWLDHARSKFGYEPIFTLQESIKIVGVFSVLPIFSCLRNEAGEYWVVIAGKMNTTVFGYIMYPNMLVHVMPIALVLSLILYRMFIGKLLTSMGFRYPLQYMILGGFLAVISLVISVIVASVVEVAQPARTVPEKVSQLRIYNPTACMFIFECVWLSRVLIEIQPMNYTRFTELETEDTVTLNYTLFTRCQQIFPVQNQLMLTEGKSMGYFFQHDKVIQFEDNAIQPEDGFPLLRLLANTPRNNTDKIKIHQSMTEKTLQIAITNTTQIRMDPGLYSIGNFELQLHMGDVSVLLYDALGTSGPKIERIDITRANTVHVGWLLPQHFTLGFAIILFQIHGNRLAYIEAPDNKKSTFLSYWALVTGIGSMLTWVIDFLHAFTYVTENLIFVTLTSLTIVLVFSAFALNYDYVDCDAYS